ESKMASVNQQLDSLLFLLPWELRHRIYEHYLSFTHEDFTDTLRPTHMYLDVDIPHTTPLPPLMMACKSAYIELAPWVHSTAALRVRHPGAGSERRIGFAAHGTMRFDRLRYLVLIIDLEYAYWNAWLDFFGAVATRTCRLEHLIVDWAPRPLPHASSGWQARRDEKKERDFLDLLHNLSTLQTLKFHGQIPGRWTRELQVHNTALAISRSTERWWGAPGFN
ncbi:hypothetical protein BGZ63DRAFT_365444, partial [Mariannaea sp. PMI_226]